MKGLRWERQSQMSHVLVIDDSGRIRTAVKAMLESVGFDVSVAADGEEGLDQFRQERFDLVISDIAMPRKDGFQTIRELREMTPDLPIIAMSGGMHFAGCVQGSTCDALSLAEDLGATRTISKPFSRDNLLSVIRESMSEAGSQFLDEHARW
jgi:CheY-like chemotaxis protein